MPIYKLNRSLVAVAIAQLFATAAFAADNAAPAAPADAPEAAAAPMQTVTVGAQRSRGTAARLGQEDAPNLVNIVTSEDIRKLPDVNAAEAMRRMPGISMSMGSGEGRFINIRGLDSDLTSTTFGGVRLPPTNVATPFGGGRAVEMGVIPAGMIGSITVTKTNKPEQDAEALGGTVEITPKSLPPSGESFLDAKIGAGREALRNTPVRDFSISGGTRFGLGTNGADPGLSSYSDKPFSLVGSMSYYQDKRGVDDAEAGYAMDSGKSSYPKAYSNFDQRDYNMTRNRYGFGGELAYEPDAANKWYVRYYDSGYRETINRNRLTFNMSGNAVLNPDGSFTDPKTTFTKSLRDEQETMSSQVFTAGGKNAIGEATFDYRIAHTTGSDNRPFDYNSTFSNPIAAAVTYNNVANPSYPQFSVTGVNRTDPNGYKLTGFTNTPILAKTTEWSGASNLSLPTHLSSAEHEEFKTGVSARLRTNNYSVTPYTYTAVPGAPLSQFIDGSPVTYYDGNYANGYNISVAGTRDLYVQGNGFVRNLAADTLSAQRQATHNTEDVLAAYVQEQMTFGKLGLLAGLRVENTKAHYQGNALAGTTVTPMDHSNSYNNLFPSVQARYQLDKSSLVRASFSTTIARPGFNQTSAATTIDVGNNIVTTGNPNLKPVLSRNFDLSFEHYLPRGGIVSLGLFDKALTNYIVARTGYQTFPNSGAYAGLGPNTKLVSYDNVSSAHARGLEANYEQHYTFLPGFLGGLGTSVNWTLVDSKLEIRPGEYTTLPSTSRNTYNAALFWERNGLNLRLSTNYMSRNMYAVGSSSSRDVYAEPRRSADFGASYQLAKNYGIFASVKNLTNTALKYSEGTPDRLIQREFYGRTFEGGLTFNF